MKTFWEKTERRKNDSRLRGIKGHDLSAFSCARRPGGIQTLSGKAEK